MDRVLETSEVSWNKGHKKDKRRGQKTFGIAEGIIISPDQP